MYLSFFGKYALTHSIPKVRMKNWPRERQFCTYFMFPNYFHGELASFPWLMKLQAGLSFLLPSLARLNQTSSRDVFLFKGKGISDPSVLHAPDAKHQTKLLSFAKI